MYGSLCIDHPVSRLFNDTNAEYKTFSVFSKCMSDVMVDLKLAKNTRKTAFYALKNVLKKVGFSENFVNRLHLCTEKPLTKYDSRLVLKKKYNRLSDDLPIKKMLTSWITILKTKTKNHSPNTIKIMIAFFLNTCIPALGLCIEILANDVIPVKIDITQKMVDDICTNVRKCRWFNLFCEFILGVKNEHKPNMSLGLSDELEYISGDVHVINSCELDRIYIEASKNTLDELVFLLLITTGMRIGGMLNIKIPHICTTNGNEIKVFNTGRTLEKGCKWFDFVINDRVKELIIKWMTNERRGGTDYLFSSSRNSGRNIASITMRVRFKRLCERAGLSGPHLHLHSLRHSYAHMLLKCGNSVSVISKLLNHSSTDVTEKFYLRETISEVTDRAHIPWIKQGEKNNDNILPNFLKRNGEKINHKMKRLEYLSAMYVT